MGLQAAVRQIQTTFGNRATRELLADRRVSEIARHPAAAEKTDLDDEVGHGREKRVARVRELQARLEELGFLRPLDRNTESLAADAKPSRPAAGTVPPAAAVPGALSVGSVTFVLRSLQFVSLDQAAVAGLIAMGITGESDLTNVLFWCQHPEKALRKIEPGEGALAADWLRLRESIVRPALKKSREGPEPKGPTKPEPPSRTNDAGGIGPERLRAYRDAETSRFRREVYRRQLARSRRRKEFFPGIPVADLRTVEGRHRLHRVAAGDAQDLLSAARRDLAGARERGEALALKVESIGITSAYRDPERDFSAWKNAFATHYRRTATRRADLKGGPHGDAAINLMVRRMVVKKAVPGFSNHTKGLAIDFRTKQGKWTLGASSAQSAGWPRTWLHRWLVAHAANYHFHPYEAEPWHWDHRT